MRGFSFAEFDAQCSELDADQLQLKWQHYNSALSAASNSTVVETLTAGPIGVVSMIGAMIAGPLMHNARKKRNIIEKHMALKGLAPDTSKRDDHGSTLQRDSIQGAADVNGVVDAGALAVDKVARIVSHVVLDDDALAKTQPEPKDVSSHEERQLSRSASMPATDSSASEMTVEVLLKHANTLPASLGASATGLLASASRIAERYPLLKEYISSVATQSKCYMSLNKTGGNGLSPAGRNWTEPATRSEVDSDPLPDISSTSTDALGSPSLRPVAQRFAAELEGDSYYSSSLVSPLGSSVAELDGELDHGSVSPCDTLFEVEGDHAFDNLLKKIDETALSEVENELQLAIHEMDGTTSGIEDTAIKRFSRSFHRPSDLDNIVRRQSQRYSERCGSKGGRFSSKEIQSNINQASVPPLRSSRSFSGIEALVEDNFKVKGESEPSSPTGTILPAYAETDPSIAPEACLTNASPAAPSTSLFGWHGSSEKECVASIPPPYMRGGGLSHSEPSSSGASSTRLIVSNPMSPELVVRTAPTVDTCAQAISNGSLMPSRTQPVEVVESTCPAPSKMGKRALSAHNGMKKVGYFGLEPAAKMALGGSLLLMGVRPSVQRKMLDKAKRSIGMPETEKTKNDDDDYMDYV